MWKKILLLQIDGLIVGIGSVLYGCKLIFSPEMMNQYRTYEVIAGIFESPVLAYAFVVFGILKIMGVVFNNQTLKVVSIFALFFLWTLFMTSFLIVDLYYQFPTSLGILCLFPVFLAGKVALKEV